MSDWDFEFVLEVSVDEIYCNEFTGHKIELILKRINKMLSNEGQSAKIINIETVRSKSRSILVRVWWTV